MVAKTIFWYCAIMLLISEKTTGSISIFFFASKEAYQIVRQLEKITVKKAEAKVVKCAKKHLSVKLLSSKISMSNPAFAYFFTHRAETCRITDELW